MQETVSAKDLIAEYGLGLMSQVPNTWGHNGDSLGYETVVIYNTTHDVSVVILTNTQPNPAQVGAFIVMNALEQFGYADAPAGVGSMFVP